MVFVKISSLHPLVLLALAGCLGNGRHSESGGTAWDPVPASQVDSVEVVQFGHSYAAIFPAGYRVPVRGTRRFTPSPALIRDIEPRVREQFRDALINQVERQLNDPTSYGGPLSAEDRERLWKAHLKGINRLIPFKWAFQRRSRSSALSGPPYDVGSLSWRSTWLISASRNCSRTRGSMSRIRAGDGVKRRVPLTGTRYPAGKIAA